MSTDGLKQRKEDFVTGLTGGSVSEIYLCTLVATSTYFAWCALQSRFQFFKTRALPNQLVDVSLTWIAPLLTLTLYSSIPTTLNIMVLLPSIAILALNPAKPNKHPSKASTPAASGKASPLRAYLPKLPFLTIFRGNMMVLTCLAILAVDFRIFPRRFAKVETWGTSLMDLGVGSFVFSMGLVSARSTLVDAYLEKSTPRTTAISQSFRQALPVLALGVVRLALVKAFDYQEHVTEYGIHWNFFVTLGLLPPFVSLVDMFPKKVPLAFISLAIAIVYEFLLNNGGLIAYIITAPRDNFFSQNREGIFSFIGYLSIFLFGKATGFYALPSTLTYKSYFYPQPSHIISKVQKSPARNWRKAAMLLVSGLTVHILYTVARNVFRLSASRRFANLCYVLWVVSYNLAYLSIFVGIEAYFTSPPSIVAESVYENLVPESLEAVNVNGLVVFLLANVSTGLINMSVNTLDASRELSMVILTAYAFFLAGVSAFLRSRGIVIKL